MSGIQTDQSNAPMVQVPAIVFCVVTPIFVGIRFWSRIRASNALGLDDWTILVSLIFSLAVSILMLESCDYGFGKHIAALTSGNKIMALKLFYVAQAFYKININLTKASILILYLRVFVQRPFRIICGIMLAIVLSYLIASTAAAMFQCTPVARAWDKSIPGTCINITTNWYGNAGYSIATDVIILLLPMPIIYHMHLRMNQKAGLMFVFALGGFVVVTSIMRMTTLNLSSTSPDTTYQIESSCWTIIEANVGIICACLPMCRVLLQIIFPSTFPSSEINNSSRTISSSGKFSRTGTGKNKWAPTTPDGVQLSVVNASRGDSEECILDTTVEDTYGGEATPRVIRKVTQFTVEFNGVDDNGDEEREKNRNSVA